MKSSFKKLLFPIFSVAAGLILFALLGELVFRVMGIKPHIVPTVMDEHVGILNQPGFSGIFDLEGYSHFSINSQGWRDIERQKKKPEDVFRIAVVGDSYIEAFQVESQDMLTTRLEEELQGKIPGKKVEVIPFGMSGFDAAQVFLAIQHKILPFHPDLILYGFLPGNDVKDGLRELNNLPYKPYFMLQGNTLVLDETYKDYVRGRNQSPLRRVFVFLRGNSRLFSFLVYEIFPKLKTMLLKARESAPVKKKGEEQKPTQELGLSGNEIFKAPEKGAPLERAWKVTEKLILEMNELCRAHGIRFMFFGVTSHRQVHFDPGGRLPGGYDLFYPENRMMEFARKNSLIFIPLAMELSRRNREQNTLFHGTSERPGGHWNEAGHLESARTLAREILKSF